MKIEKLNENQIRCTLTHAEGAVDSVCSRLFNLSNT